MVDKLTTIALKIERLPDTSFVRSEAWTFIHVFKGGLDSEQKVKMIEEFTVTIQDHLTEKAPIYVLIRENITEDWGILGNRITLDELFNPPADAMPI
jgi:phenylpyruvate tautomerase PptA (4-oxalocrotonate tautomerase family)